MKYIKLNNKAILLAIAMLFNLACTKDFEELNTDPSLLSEGQLDVGLLLTTVQKRMLIDNYKSGKKNIEIHIESIELLFTKYKDF